MCVNCWSAIDYAAAKAAYEEFKRTCESTLILQPSSESSSNSTAATSAVFAHGPMLIVERRGSFRIGQTEDSLVKPIRATFYLPHSPSCDDPASAALKMACSSVVAGLRSDASKRLRD